MKGVHGGGSPKGNGLLKLIIPPGKKAVVPELTDGSTTNKEVLLRREGLSIRVNQVTMNGDYALIEATVVV